MKRRYRTAEQIVNKLRQAGNGAKRVVIGRSHAPRTNLLEGWLGVNRSVKGREIVACGSWLVARGWWRVAGGEWFAAL